MREYDGKELRKTLDTIGNLTQKAKLELFEIEKENKRILEMFEIKQTKVSKNIVTGISHLIGRTPKRIIPHRVGFGSYSNYLLIECEDGQRVVIFGDDSENIRTPDFKIEQMEKYGFHTKEEIQRAKDYKDAKEKRDEEERVANKKRELERLQKELEKED
jgi:hypothetical protein